MTINVTSASNLGKLWLIENAILKAITSKPLRTLTYEDLAAQTGHSYRGPWKPWLDHIAHKHISGIARHHLCRESGGAGQLSKADRLHHRQWQEADTRGNQAKRPGADAISRHALHPHWLAKQWPDEDLPLSEFYRAHRLTSVGFHPTAPSIAPSSRL